MGNKLSQVEENEELFKVKLTAKKDISNTNTQIKLIEAQTVNNDRELNGSEAELNIEIKKDINMALIFVIVIIGLVIGTVIGYLLVKNKKGDN